jgi:hypothetical protein
LAYLTAIAGVVRHADGFVELPTGKENANGKYGENDNILH